MNTEIKFRTQGRGPGTYLALFVGLMVGLIAWELSANSLIFGLIACYLTLVIWRLAANPGMRLQVTDKGVHIEDGETTQNVPLDRIAEVELTDVIDGKPACTLRLTDGSRVDLPARVLPASRNMARALAQRGFPVTRPKSPPQGT